MKWNVKCFNNLTTHVVFLIKVNGTNKWKMATLQILSTDECLIKPTRGARFINGT